MPIVGEDTGGGKLCQFNTYTLPLPIEGEGMQDALYGASGIQQGLLDLGVTLSPQGADSAEPAGSRQSELP